MSAVRRTRSVELGWRLHRLLYRVTGGLIGARVGPLPVLLLTVRGRKSGEARTVALNYLMEGDRYVVFASHAGEDREPPRWLNLRAAGEATVQIGVRTFRVRAHEAEGEARERLWSAVIAKDGAYAIYQGRTSRRIAVIMLDPI